MKTWHQINNRCYGEIRKKKMVRISQLKESGKNRPPGSRRKYLFDDGSAEGRIPLLDSEFEVTDRGSLISKCDEHIERYLTESYHKLYHKSQTFVTPAYCEEERKIIHNTQAWWK